MSSFQQSIASVRQCVYCGKSVPSNHPHCPHCREVVPKVRLAPAPTAVKGSQIRRGFLYMLLGLIIHFVAFRSDSLNIPFSVNHTVSYIPAIMILGGVGLSLYGLLYTVTA